LPHNRYFTSDPLQQTAILTGPEFQHLTRVMRAKEGDTVELVNGQGDLALATIDTLTKRSATLTLSQTTTAEPDPPLILAQALPRPNRLATIREKGTELGATAFLLFPGQRSERTTTSLERAHAITIAALKQSGRLHLPTIELRPPLLEWTTLPTPAFVADLHATTPLQPTSPATVFIGPESGFTLDELTHLTTLGATPVRLHRNTLRTDTAALAALTLLSINK
jgi:16S rRNA (uracil1498-N3)-methyltransferase